MHVLFVSFGTNGWTLEVYSEPTKIYLPMWVWFHLANKPTRYNHIIQGRRLYQQLVVDMWAIDENSKLTYFKLNQAQIRADAYPGVQQSVAEGMATLSGSTVLPASFSGNRWYNNTYKDAMSIVRAEGKPYLILTMTIDIGKRRRKPHIWQDNCSCCSDRVSKER